MLTVQVAVTLDAGIDDPAIQTGADLDAVRPVLSRELRLQAGQVFVFPADEPALYYLGSPSQRVLPGKPADQRCMLHIQFEVVVLDAGLLHVEPWTAEDLEFQWEPVGHVDQVLVLHLPICDLAGQAVVKAGYIGCWIVDVVGLGLGQGATRNEVPVAQRAERLAQPLACGIEALIDQRPYVGRPLGVSPPDLLGGLPFLQPALDEGGKGDVVQGSHHQVGADIGQLLLVAKAGDADGGKAAGLGRLHPARRILDDETRIGGKSELLRSGQEDHGVGLSASKVAAGDIGIEQLLQGHPTAYEAIGEALFGSEGVESNPFE